MKHKVFHLLAAVSLLLVSFSIGCATKYTYRAVPAKPLDSFANLTEVQGIQAGAKAYYDKKEASNLFGFDISGVGVVPAQVTIKNNTNYDIILDEGAYLKDINGDLWQSLPFNIAAQRVTKAFENTKSFFQDGAKVTTALGAVGAIAGVAAGTVSGTNIGSAAGKGAVIGAALGASSSILKNLSTSKVEPDLDIMYDLSERNLFGKVIPSGKTIYGIIYFPKEAKTPKSLVIDFAEAQEIASILDDSKLKSDLDDFEIKPKKLMKKQTKMRNIQVEINLSN